MNNENTSIENVINEAEKKVIDEKERLKAVQTADKHVDNIYRHYDRAENAFLQIACELHFLQDENRYKYASALGSNNDISFIEFSESMFGFKKSQTYALVGLVDRFGVINKNGTYSIADNFKEYGQTQLINMTKLTDDEIRLNIEPEMSVAEIKKLVKQISKVKASVSDDEIDISTDELEESVDSEKTPTVTTATNGVEVVTTSTANNTQAIMSFKNYDDFINNLEEIKKEVKKILSISNYEITLNYTW